MAIHIYGENGITFKIADKLNRQNKGYAKFMRLMRVRYRNMHGRIDLEDFKSSRNRNIYLFPNFGKRGRSGESAETCFGEPDMIISNGNAIFLFEFETKSFSKLLHIPKRGSLTTKSLAYQLCRFYQLGELLVKLNNKQILKNSDRRVNARYCFKNQSGERKRFYYFSFRKEYFSSHSEEKWNHSFEKMVAGLLEKKKFYVVSVTKDRSYDEALQGLKKMLEIAGKDKYKPEKFIVLIYDDLQSDNVFGQALQLDLEDARQGFQEIRKA